MPGEVSDVKVHGGNWGQKTDWCGLSSEGLFRKIQLILF